MQRKDDDPSIPRFEAQKDTALIRRMREHLKYKGQQVSVTQIENVPGIFWTVTAVHDTTLGQFNRYARPPYGTSLGGFRVIESGSIDDAVRLAQLLAGDMTRKWAVMYRMLADMYHSGRAHEHEVHAAGMGGSKSVLAVGDLQNFDALPGVNPAFRKSAMSQHARHIMRMNGPITAVDMHTNSADMDVIAIQTESNERRLQYVACQSPELGGTGNPSRVTAKGVSHGTKAMMELLGIDPNTARVAVMGVGQVGSNTVDILRSWYPGMNFVIADTDSAKTETIVSNFGTDHITVDTPEHILQADVDIIIPAAGPEVLTMDVLQDRSPRLKAIVSAANDPWPMIAGEPDPKIVSAYFTHGIAVPPAYVTNLGGILDVASGYWEAWGGGRPNPQKTRAMDLVSGVEDLVRMLYLNSQTDHRPMEDLGQDLAAETLIQFSQSNNIPLPV